MAQLALVAIAAGVSASGALGTGFVAGMAGMALTAAASYAGAMIDRALTPPAWTRVEGPHLGDVKMSGATYGLPIPMAWGSVRLPGNLIWTDGLTERTKTTVTSNGGGKGGGKNGGGSETTTVTYYYTSSFAMGFCLGPAEKIVKIFADGQKVYDVLTPPITPVTDEWGYTPPPADSPLIFRFYPGSETQAPDALISSIEGAQNTPAFRGLCYIVCEDVALEAFGNRLPSITAEIAFATESSYVARGVGGSASAGVIPDDLYYSNSLAAFDSMRAYSYRTAVTRPFTDEAVSGVLKASMIRLVEKTWTSAQDIMTRGGLGDPGALAWITDVAASNGTLLYAVMGSQLIAVEPASMRALAVVDLAEGWGTMRVIHARTPYGTGDLIFGSVAAFIGPIGGNGFRSLTVSGGGIGDPFIGRNTATEIELWGVGSAGTVQHASFVGTGFQCADAFTIPAADIFPVGMIGFLVLGACYDTAHDALIVSCATAWDTEGGRVAVAAISRTGAVIWAVDHTLPRDPVNQHTTITIDGSSRLLGSEFMFLSEQFILGGQNARYVTRIDLRTGAMIERQQIYSSSVSGFNIIGGYDSTTNSLYTTDQSGQARVNRSIQAGLTPLSEVVGDICIACGLAEADFDVSDLASDGVRGFISSQEAGRDPIAQLSSLFFFDLAESDGILRFRKRGSAVNAVVPYSKVVRGSDGSALKPVRMQAFEVPAAITVRYPNTETDQQQGTQRYSRSTAPVLVRTIAGVGEMTLDTRIVMTPDEAKTLAKRQLLSMWAERDSYSEIQVGQEYLALEPADVITLGLSDGVSDLRLRLTKVDIGGDFTMLLSGVVEDASIVRLTTTASGGTGYRSRPMPSYYMPLSTLLALPLLQDSDNTSGSSLRAYLSASSYDGQDFQGAQYLIGDQPAEDYSRLGGLISIGTPWGSMLTAVTDCADPWITDWDTALVVQMAVGGDSLTTASWDQVLAGANAFALETGAGDVEVMQFQVVEQISVDRYRLTGITRGRKGSEWVCGLHRAGDRFVLLIPYALVPHTIPTAALNAERWLKIMGQFDTFDTAQNWQTAFHGTAEKPYAPCHVAGSRDGSNNLTVTWLRRSRLGGEWTDGVESVPLGEESEAYAMDVLLGGTVVRTVAGLTSPAATYSAAEQVADGVTPGDAVTVRVYQISALVGRGNPAEATI